MSAFGLAETAKRRLILELTELKLPIECGRNRRCPGLSFDLLSSAWAPVAATGYRDGVITLDLAAADISHRERRRAGSGEPFRNVLGDMRHEVGHHYCAILVDSGGTADQRQQFNSLFGDPDADYPMALNRHYETGAPPGWWRTHVSAYAAAHPREDFAETFAHYLHIRDTLDTSATFAMAPASATYDAALPDDVGFDRLVSQWLPLTWAFNQLNRSMGHQGLYPLVPTDPVLDKIRYVHTLVTSAARRLDD